MTLAAWRHGETVPLRGKVGRLGLVVSKKTPREALGGASGATSRSTGLEPLPGTRREVTALGKTVESSRARTPLSVNLLLGEDATKARLRALAPRARYIHLATHQIPGETAKAPTRDWR